jgi:ABC-type transport system involved in multi-copper enzyme maturation permease subunit
MTELTATTHKIFSPARVRALAANTLLELVRLKVFSFLLIFALLIIGSSLFTARLTFQEQFQVLKDVSLGAMSIFSWLLAVLATSMLLPKDIEDRTLYTILAKPVPRSEYLLGKLLGVFALLFVALSFMSVLFVLVLYAGEQTAVAQAGRGLPPEAAAAAAAAVRATTFTSSLLPCIVVIYLKAALCAAFTMLLSTFATSSIFTIIVSVVVYLIGHVQPIARDYWLASATVGVPTRIFLALISLIFPDLTAFNLVDDVVAGNVVALALFGKTVALGLTYIAAYFLAGLFMFSAREL